LLIVGSPGSGRTTALVTIAIQAAQAGREVCVIGDEHSDLARVTTGSLFRPRAPAGRDSRLAPTPRVHRLSWDQDEDLVALRRTHADLVVVADDIERHLDAPVVPALEQVADLADRDGGLIAVCGDSAVVGLRPRGLGPAVARGRLTLVLGAPTPMDGDLAGVRLQRVSQVVPGRGWLVADRKIIPVQVATPEGASLSVPG